MVKNKTITLFFKRKNEKQQVEGIDDEIQESKRQKGSTSEPVIGPDTCNEQPTRTYYPKNSVKKKKIRSRPSTENFLASLLTMTTLVTKQPCHISVNSARPNARSKATAPPRLQQKHTQQK